MQSKGRWHPSTMRNSLHNPVYTGNVYSGRTRACTARQRRSPLQPLSRTGKRRTMTSANEWTLMTQIPAVITQEQFAAVQAKLVHTQQFARRNNPAHAYLLRAMVSCGLCRRACLARTNGGNADYVCRGKLHRGLSDEPEPCPSRMAPAGQVDTLVWRDVETVIHHPEVIAQALQRATQGAWLPQELQARQEQVRKARGSLDHQVERLTEAYLGAVIPLEEYRRRRQELEARQMSLTRQAGHLQASMERQLEFSTLVDSIETCCARIRSGLEQATFEQRRQVVERFVDRVVVTNDEVEIRDVIPTTAASEHVRFCHLRADYFGRKAVALVGRGSSCLHAASIAHVPVVSGRSAVYVTIPLDQIAHKGKIKGLFEVAIEMVLRHQVRKGHGRNRGEDPRFGAHHSLTSSTDEPRS